jgi:hypothetical protein
MNATKLQNNYRKGVLAGMETIILFFCYCLTMLKELKIEKSRK